MTIRARVIAPGILPSSHLQDRMSSEFRLSSEVSKTDAAIANIPSTVDVPEEDVSENPKHCVIYRSALFAFKAMNKLTSGQTRVRRRTSDASTRTAGDRSKVE